MREKGRETEGNERKRESGERTRETKGEENGGEGRDGGGIGEGGVQWGQPWHLGCLRGSLTPPPAPRCSPPRCSGFRAWRAGRFGNKCMCIAL